VKRLDASARVTLCLVGLLLPSAPAFAFPGSVRWGYGNCATCHYNVAGGGILTDYGRQLSRELLSTWGGEQEARFAYGARLPSWLALGGDVASLVAEERLRLVKADFEAAVLGGRWLAVASVGRGSDATNTMGRDWISRRHYLQFQATPTLSLRAGRFLPNYGVWNGDASVATRAGLGLDCDSYNVEANWIAERFNVALGGFVAGTSGWDTERGVSASAGWFFGNKRKVWLSALSRGKPGMHRRAVGLSSVIGVGSRAYLLAQLDVQHLRQDTTPPSAPAAPGTPSPPTAPQETSNRELLANLCFARETFKGLYVLVFDEAVRRDLGERVSHSYGVGLRWFPRPHFELQVRYRSRDGDAMAPQFLDGFSAMLHFYP
jgi:hypothetical protein